MEGFIPLDKFIQSAAKKGVDFGKGDPYNRLRYYTKLGLLPHMQRKVVGGEVIGHYPSSALETLWEIERLKGLGLSNQDIQQRLKELQPAPKVNLLKAARLITPSPRVIKGTVFLLIGFVLLAGFGFLPVGKSKTDLIQKTLELDKKFISDSGNAYVPREQTKVYIKSASVKLNSKINISFSQNYTPATRFWVSQKVPFEGFYVELDAPVAADSEFSWWVSN